MNRRPDSVAVLAWLALAAQVVFVAAWLLSGSLQDDYSHVDQYVSELGAATAESPWIVNGAIVVLGVSLMLVAAGLRSALPRRPRAAVAVALFGLCGLLYGGAGLFAVECAPTLSSACEARFEAGDASWQSYAHHWAGLALSLLLPLTPFAIAWALWPRPLGRLALVGGVIGGALGLAVFLAGFGDSSVGVFQRLSFGLVHAWIGLVAVGLLVWSGGRRPRPAPGPREGGLEPFRFLAPRYSGSGAIEYSPWLRWMPFPRRFSFERSIDYEGSAMWLVHDVLRFEDGPTFDRTMVARPLGHDRMHLTGDDMPGGADTVLVPGGLVLEPSWFLVPYGGVRWPQRWRGELRLLGEDGIDAGFEISMFGFLPLGRVAISLVRERSEVHAA